MVRSKSLEGPFVEDSLLKKADAARASGRHDVIKIWSRRSTILPQFVGLTFGGVYNGQKHVPVAVNEVVGHKFGEFSPTRTFHGMPATRKPEIRGGDLVMSKPKRERALPDNEARRLPACFALAASSILLRN